MTGPGGTKGAAVRNATDDDLADISRIYAFHVENGLASFEETPPSVDEMARRLAAVRAQGLPYLVAECGGGVRGYAYATCYRDRSAYRYSVESSVYVDRDWVRRGVANALLQELILRCTAAGRRQMIAVIGDSGNVASIGLHARHGFRVAGMLPSVGYKFGRWVDSILMVLALGDGDHSHPND